MHSVIMWMVRVVFAHLTGEIWSATPGTYGLACHGGIVCPGEARLLQRHISLLQWQCLDVAAFAFGATHFLPPHAMGHKLNCHGFSGWAENRAATRHARRPNILHTYLSTSWQTVRAKGGKWVGGMSAFVLMQFSASCSKWTLIMCLLDTNLRLLQCCLFSTCCFSYM